MQINAALTKPVITSNPVITSGSAAATGGADSFGGTQKASFRSCPVTGHKPAEGMEPSGKAGKGVCPFAGMKAPGQQ